MAYYEGFSFDGFWKKKQEDGWPEPEPTDEVIDACEKRLGYLLPKSYIALMRMTQNGGLLAKDTFLIKDADGAIIKTLTCTYLEPVGNRLLSRENQRQSLPDIGIYFGMYTEARRMEYFAFDYSLCGVSGEPQISFVENTKPGVMETTVIAANFEEFAKLLIKKPKIPTPVFDFEKLKELLADAAQQSFLEIVNQHGKENINAFALYTDGDATMLGAAANTYMHLQKLLEAFPDEKSFYTYATTEWAYEGYGAQELFEVISAQLFHHVSLLATDAKIRTFRNKLLDICIEVLDELKCQEFFKEKCGHEIVLMVNTSDGDLSQAKLQKIIRALNPPSSS